MFHIDNKNRKLVRALPALLIACSLNGCSLLGDSSSSSSKGSASSTSPTPTPTPVPSPTPTPAPADPISLSITAPSGNLVSKAASTSIQWSVSGGAAGATNQYQVKVYPTADCSGTASSTSQISVTNYNLTGILDGGVYSVGVTASNDQGQTADEVCSPSITGNATIADVTVATGAVYLALDVDFTNKLAYLGANYTGTFVDVVDFSTEGSPTLFKTIGASTTPSSSYTYSRGVALYNNGTRLVVGTDGGSALELYDLTSTPRTGTWTKLSSISVGGNPRKIAKVINVNSSDTRVYVALRRGYAAVDITEPTGSMSVSVSNSSYGNCWGNGAILGSAVMMMGCYTSSTLQAVDLVTGASSFTLPVSASVDYWSAAASSDGLYGYIGGSASIFLAYSAGGSPVVSTTYKATMSPGGYSRDSVFVTENSKRMLYDVTGSYLVSAWDVSDINAPVLVAQKQLTGSSEAYGIRVDPASHRAYITTTDGRFIILNTEMLAAPTSTLTAF